MYNAVGFSYYAFASYSEVFKVVSNYKTFDTSTELTINTASGSSYWEAIGAETYMSDDQRTIRGALKYTKNSAGTFFSSLKDYADETFSAVYHSVLGTTTSF